MQHTLEGSTPANITDYKARDPKVDGGEVLLSYVTEDKQQIKEWMSLKQAHVLFPSEVEKFLRNLYCSTETHSAQVDARQMWSSLGLYPPLNRKRKNRA